MTAPSAGTTCSMISIAAILNDSAIRWDNLFNDFHSREYFTETFSKTFLPNYYTNW
jgi:hypothetical protein